MDKTFKEYSQLPEDLQYKILKDNEEVRTARYLSSMLRKASLYDKINQDILLIPTVKEIENYLETLPLHFKVFYQHQPDNNYDERVGNLVGYDYSDEIYMFQRYIVCRVDGGNGIRQIFYSEVDKSSFFSPKDVAVQGRNNGKDSDIHSEIIIPGYTPIVPIETNIVYYDLLTYRWVITERLKNSELPDNLLSSYSIKYILRYLDEIVLESNKDNQLFIYYFLVSNAHLLGIPLTMETREYFTNYDFEYNIKDTENPHFVRMSESIIKIYPLIKERLVKCF